MSLSQISHLTFSYPGSYDPVFTDVNLRLDSRWKLGLTGRNGRGKTTLLRILAGEYPQTGIEIREVPRIFPCPVAHPEHRVAAVAREVTGDMVPDWMLERELNLLGLWEAFLERTFSTLSQGEQARVLLAALFLQEGSYPLIDEPTNHLDAGGRARLGEYLRSRRQWFLLVSHDRVLLDTCVDHMLSIERTGLSLMQGNYSVWQRERDRRDAGELAENDRLTREIHRLQEGARRAAAWSDKVEKGKYATRNSGLRVDRGYVGHQSARMMQQAKNIEARREKAIVEKTALLKNLETAEDLKLWPMEYPDSCLVRCRDLSVCYGGQEIFAPVTFELHGGERLALAGANGSGKSSVLRLICGEKVPHSGLCEIASGLVISRVAQSPEPFDGTPGEYAQHHNVDKSLFLAILRKLGFERVQFEKRISDLSAGQQKKLMLARSLCQRAHLYLWDEPLNYIDVISRRQIEELILRYRPTLLFVEHDRAFCQTVATRTVELAQYSH